MVTNQCLNFDFEVAAAAGIIPPGAIAFGDGSNDFLARIPFVLASNWVEGRNTEAIISAYIRSDMQCAVAQSREFDNFWVVSTDQLYELCVPRFTCDICRKVSDMKSWWGQKTVYAGGVVQGPSPSVNCAEQYPSGS